MKRVSPIAAADQADLFERPILSELAFTTDFLSAAEEQALIGHLEKEELSPFRFQQWTGKRLTRSYGWNYDFENGAFAQADPMPVWLETVRDGAARFAGLEPTVLVQALLIRYDPGSGISWHRDRPVFEHVVGISLGEPAVMRFRRRSGSRFERTSAPLAPRSIYHMSGEARHDWEHSIVEMIARRWSITFRSLAEARPS